jgi:plasmid stability protein
MTTQAKQITVRSIPARVHKSLRAKAAARGISVNAFVVEAIEAAVGLPTGLSHDMDDLAGSWIHDDAVDAELRAQRTIHPRDWE